MLQKFSVYLKHLSFLRKNKYKTNLFLFLKSYSNKKVNSEEYVLTQIVYDYYYLLKLAAFTQSYSSIHNKKIIAYDTYFSWNPIINFLNLFTGNGFKYIYSSFAHDIISNIQIYRKTDKKKIGIHYSQIINNLKVPEDILAIKFDEIEVGDLIYDTYLRFYKKPTIFEINDDVKKVIKYALIIFYNFNRIFLEKNIKIFITSLTSYIHHGIPTRMCLKRNIPVYAISSYFYIAQKVEKHFPYHSIDHTKLFNKVIKDARYDVKKIFEERFTGAIDGAISYMRKSSFSLEDNSSQLISKFSEKNRNVVIYIHDFYDSPHINRNLYFKDLYDFLDSVIQNLYNNDTNFFIKPHPNSVYNSNDLLLELLNKHSKPNVHLLNSLISNNDIIKLRPDLVVTARGTIGIEMAYMGIPVVALYDNPYINFDFVHTCFSIQEYYDIINGVKTPKIDFNQSKILSFYYQYFYEKTVEDQYNIFSNIFDSRLLANEIIFDPKHSKHSIIQTTFINSKLYINDYIIKNSI